MSHPLEALLRRFPEPPLVLIHWLSPPRHRQDRTALTPQHAPAPTQTQLALSSGPARFDLYAYRGIG